MFRKPAGMLLLLMAAFMACASAPARPQARSAAPLPTPAYEVPEAPAPTPLYPLAPGGMPPLQAPAAGPATDPATEGRGIWIEMKTLPRDPAGIRALVARLARCHFNFLLVEVTYEGATLYPSSLTQQDPRFAGSDPLAVLVDEAHRRGIEVHAWMWVMKQGRYRANDAHPGGPILALHPDWMALDREGRPVSPGSSYYWLCPSNPQARAFVIAQMEELVTRYPLDGVHLDYIRFDRLLAKGAPPPFCFCKHCRDEYARSTGLDPATLQPFTPAYAAWEQWRENLINALVAEASVRVKARRPDALLSAAVYPDPEAARRYYAQDWALWVRNRWVDFVIPMLYRDHTDGFVRRLEQYRASGLPAETVLLPGIGVNEIEHRIFSHDVLISQVLAARAHGFPGTALFSCSVMTPYFEQFLIDRAFSRPAALPFRVASRAPLAAPPQPAAPSVVPLAEAFRSTPTLRLHRIHPDALPRLDGVLRDAAWRHGPVARLACAPSGEPAGGHTWARAATDGRTLYLAFYCPEPHVKRVVAYAHRPRRTMAEEDHVSVYLDPGPSRSQYLVLSVDVLGRRQLEKVPNGSHRPAGVDTPENVPDGMAWRAAVHVEQRAWSVEMAVPLAALCRGAQPSPLRLGVNFERMRRVGAHHRFMQWSPTYGSPYEPYRFGTAE